MRKIPPKNGPFSFLASPIFWGVAIGIVVVTGLVANSMSVQQAIIQQETGVTASAKWNIYIRDILNEGAAVTSGTISIYDMDNPTEIVETLTVSSGSVNTTKAYTTGERLFLKYTDTTWLNYGMVVVIPKLDRDYDSVPTLDLDDVVYVYKSADLTGTDVDGLKNGAVVWEEGTDGTNTFNVTTDTDPKLGIMLTNEDDDTAYVDPRGWTDYSTDVPQLRNRGAWLIINFEPNLGGSAITDANDYLRFKSVPSGMQKIKISTSMVLAYPLTTDFLAGARNVDTAGNPISGLDGQGITIFTIVLDFTGAISGILDGDDIDIEVTLFSSFAMDYLTEYDTFAQAGDDPLGEENAGWTNDWSIGGGP